MAASCSSRPQQQRKKVSSIFRFKIKPKRSPGALTVVVEAKIMVILGPCCAVQPQCCCSCLASWLVNPYSWSITVAMSNCGHRSLIRCKQCMRPLPDLVAAEYCVSAQTR
eukprot:13888-Heterococcus_DN1.PRE.2